MTVTSHTVQITNLGFRLSYVTTWLFTKNRWFSADLITALVDEVDSILIDEARTPLIISGMGEDANDLYRVADMFVKRLEKVVVTVTRRQTA